MVSMAGDAPLTQVEMEVGYDVMDRQYIRYQTGLR